MSDPLPKLLLQVSHPSSFLIRLLRFHFLSSLVFSQLISSAFQRCRLAEDLCRLSLLLLHQSAGNDPPITSISSNLTLLSLRRKSNLSSLNCLSTVSDTGIGCSLVEFQDLRCPREFNGANIWG